MVISVMKKEPSDIYCVVPNFNGSSDLKACINSLLSQTLSCNVIVVDNNSSDASIDVLNEYSDKITVLKNEKNLGFAGGVNTGLKFALEHKADCIALFNNDAVADPNWLENLYGRIKSNEQLGIVTSKIVSIDGAFFDSTGDFYTAWGMPFPRGRHKNTSDQYDEFGYVFSGSGCASLYRADMLKEIGLFDEDFFAYFEDVDISFRAQLAGWKVAYEPTALVRHKIGATSSKMSGFGTYQTFKNLPLLMLKNVPLSLLPGIWLRFFIFYSTTLLAGLFKDNFFAAFRGFLMSLVLTPKKLVQRYNIQRKRKASIEYIKSIIIYDLPPHSNKLRKLRRAVTGH